MTADPVQFNFLLSAHCSVTLTDLPPHVLLQAGTLTRVRSSMCAGMDSCRVSTQSQPPKPIHDFVTSLLPTEEK